VFDVKISVLSVSMIGVILVNVGRPIGCQLYSLVVYFNKIGQLPVDFIPNGV